MLRHVWIAAIAACSSPATPPTTPQVQAPPTAPPTENPGAPMTETPDAAFAKLAERFLARYLELSPVDATIAGEHRWDGRWPDVSVAGDTAYRAFVEQTRSELGKLSRPALNAQNQVDAEILDGQLRLSVFTLDALKPAEKNPMFYTNLIGEGLDPLVSREFGTKEQRMTSLHERLGGIPALVAVAKQRLGRPSKIHTETAIQQNAGLIALVESELPPKFAEVPARQQDLVAAAKKAAVALRELQDFLQKDVLPRSDGSFRLGRDLFAKKLALVLHDELDIDGLAKDARAILVQTQGEMVDTAKQIWTAEKLGKLPALATDADKKAFVKKVLDHVAKDRPSNRTILADAKKTLDKATAFVKEHDLVRVPDEPVVIIEMPEYRRGVAIAYCDSSGPLEATPQTFYAISPTPKDWAAPRVESFFREYNQAMLANLSVHEAMPGHYLQLMHNNKFASKLRAVFSSGPFVEGWAVYTEWMMTERGFGGPRVKLQRQKMLLRAAANTILDHDIHTGDMEEKEALALMTGEAFQEEGEAVGKWKRARLTSAQLSTYFYGFSEFMKLRRANEKTQGFTERAYHDRLLSFGSPPMKLLRQIVK
jgi:uncharacterized protein (DUF885 family)